MRSGPWALIGATFTPHNWRRRFWNFVESAKRKQEMKEFHKIQAPFTDEQIAALNEWQHSGDVHPFTCGNGCRGEPLIATTEGWKCPDCDYKQSWAHAFMAKKHDFRS